jgi:hypothetical protein
MLDSALSEEDTVGHLWGWQLRVRTVGNETSEGEIPSPGSTSASVLLITSGGAGDIED